MYFCAVVCPLLPFPPTSYPGATMLWDKAEIEDDYGWAVPHSCCQGPPKLVGGHKTFWFFVYEKWGRKYDGENNVTYLHKNMAFCDSIELKFMSTYILG